MCESVEQKLGHTKALTNCPLLLGKKKKATDTETEKLIYFDFWMFRDCINRSFFK